MVTQQEIFEKLALKAAFLMALLSLPSLALSLYGALIDDAAFVPVMVQTLLVLSLILAAIPAVPMGYKQRLLVTVIVLFIAGAVATLRYANPTIGYTYTIIISLIVALMLNRLGGYLALAAMNILVGVVAVLLFDLTPIRVALQFVTFTGTTAIGLEIIFTLIKYHSQQGEVLAEEMERQQVVSSEADIGFMEFDYELGQLDGDATIQSRFGRTVGDGPFPLDDYAHLFPTWSWKVSQSMIAEFSQKSVGTVVNFTNAMTGLLDGKEYHYRITGVNMMREGRLKFVGVSINITEEKNALEKAKDLGGQIELVSGAGGVGLIEFFPDTHTFKCNPEVSKRLAVEHSESERDLELFYAHQTEELRAQFLTQRQALVGSPDGELQVFVHPFYFANGDLHYMRVSRIKREVNGRASFLGLSLDITDEVQAKEQAEKQAEQLNLLAMSGEVAYFEVDLERGLIDGNALLKQRAGLPADAPAFPMAEIVSSIPVESRAEFEANVQRAIEVGLGGVTTFEHPYYKHDGELIYVRVTATTQMLRGRLHALGASVEITEAVRARQQAEKQAEQLKLITEQGKIGLYEFDLEKGVMYANSVLCERFGVDPEVGVITQQKLMDRLTEGAREAALAQIEAGKTQPEGYFSTSIIEETSTDGKVRKIRIFEKIERREGRPFYVGASVDVTEEVEAKERAELQAEELLNANEEIRFRTEYLENMLEAAPIPVCLLEGDSKSRNFTYVNNEVLRVLGYTKEEMLGKNATEMMFLNDEDRQFFKSKMIESMKSGIPLREEMQLYRKNKVVGNFEFNCTFNKVGEKIYGTYFVLDIDERKAKEQQLQDALRESLDKERLLKLSYSVMDLAVAELDLETNLVRLVAGDTPNKALLDQGVDFWEFYGSVYGSENAHKIRKLFDQPGESLVLPMLVNGERDHWANVGCTTEYSRDGRRYRSIYRLIVDELVGARNEAEIKARELREQQNRQAQMYAVIGHELRTPAASLKMLMDDLAEDEPLDHALVSSNVEQLLSVIDTLRAVAQPERMAKAAFKDVVIDEMLTAQVANLSALAERSGVELTADLSNLTSESVHIQSTLLRQVIANLIKNAIIHSGGDKVQLHASGELKGNHTKALTIRISDNGKGISDSKIDTLFEAYQLGDTNAEGTGLGLFVCKEIVALMGGDLHYETSEQGGAEFVIELVVNLSKQTSETPVPIDNPLEGKRVLMAEDNNVIQMLTAKMLKKQGASVVVNSDGQQALDAYAEGAFDLVLSDIFMPELDGYGLVKGLRERGYTGPIVGLTAATIGAETDLMLEAGADIVISKPIELAKLQAFLIEYDK